VISPGPDDVRLITAASLHCFPVLKQEQIQMLQERHHREEGRGRVTQTESVWAERALGQTAGLHGGDIVSWARVGWWSLARGMLLLFLRLSFKQPIHSLTTKYF